MLAVKPGIYPGVPDEEYRGLAAASASDLKEWASGEKPKAGRHMLIGSVFHEIIARPKQAGEKYGQTDADYKLNTHKGQVALQAWEMANDRIGVRPSEYATIRQMYKALQAHPATRPLLKKARGWKECAAISELYPGVMSKCLIDFLVQKGPQYTAIVDWKTTSALSEAEFVDSIVKFRYDASAAYYIDIVHENTGRYLPFFWACVSKRSYEVWLTRLDPVQYATGRRWYRDVLSLWARYGGGFGAEERDDSEDSAGAGESPGRDRVGGEGRDEPALQE